MSKPATEGVNAMDPGVGLLAFSLFSNLNLCSTGLSFEYTTYNFFTPRFFNSCRITLANGHTDV